MKKIFAILLSTFTFLLFADFCKAQYNVLYTFTSSTGQAPYGSLTLSGNMLYGTTERGGANSKGIIFSIHTDGSGYKDILDFNGTDGAYPEYGTLVLAANKLYGMTYMGGAHNYGCVFSIDTNGSNYTDLLDFNGTNGQYPEASLIYVSGVLYGMTPNGGAHGGGCVFSLDTNGTGYKDLYDFNTPTGYAPAGSLTVSGKKLYGMAENGGAYNYGAIFSLDTAGGGYTDLFDFNNTDGYNARGTLTLSEGKLYGGVQSGTYGYGRIFSIDTNGTGYTDLLNFNSTNGSILVGQLMLSGSQLFGMTFYGGANNIGTILSIDTNGTGLKNWISFNNTSYPEGKYPEGSVTLSGNTLYGMTSSGGAGYGIIFSLSTCSITATYSVTAGIGCHGDSNGSAIVTATNGTPPFTYSWSTNPVQTNAHATGLKAGTYTVTVKDSNGCVAVVPVTITQPASLGDSMFSTCATCCNCKGTTIDSIYGGTKPYTFLWSNGGTTDTLTGLPGGSYTCTVTDAKGCTKTDTVWVPHGEHVSSSSSNITCYGDNNGSASVAVAGNNTYSWAPGGQTTSSISGLSAGSYTVTISNNDTVGCVASYIFNITQPAPFTASAFVISNVLCYGQSNGKALVTTSGGTAPYTYSWSDGETSPTATKLPVGTANVTVTDKNGCTATASVSLTQPTQLTVSVPGGPFYGCGGSPVLITANANGGTPAYNYNWSPFIGNTSSIFESVQNYYCGTFYMAVTDANGCTANTSYYLNGMVLPPAFGVVNVSCNGGHDGSADVMPSCGDGPYQWSWAPGGGTNSTETGLSAGTYTVTVRDNGFNANGCTLTETVTITQPNPLVVNANVTSNVLCYGARTGSASSTVSNGNAPYTYSWSPSGGSGSSATGLSAGTYTLNVTDNSGCIGSATVNITQPNILNISANIGSEISCNGGNNGSVSANVSGGTLPYTYSWSNSQTTANASLLSAGTYTLTVTDSCGASATASVNITQPTPIVIVTDSIADNGGCNGAAWVHVSGGDSNYTYLWTGGNTTDSIYSQCYGYYCCVVTDGGLCKDSVCININLSTGTNKLSAISNQLTVYPNPNNGAFELGIRNYELGMKYQIEIYNILGEKVYSDIVHSSSLIINISNKPAGIYFYRVLKNDGGVLGDGKLIIEK